MGRGTGSRRGSYWWRPGRTHVGVLEWLLPVFRRFGIFHNKWRRNDWTANTHVSWAPMMTPLDVCRRSWPPTDVREPCLPAPFLPAPSRKHPSAQRERVGCTQILPFPHSGSPRRVAPACPVGPPAFPMVLEAPTCLGSIPPL